MDDEAIDPRADLMYGIDELREARPGYDQAQTYYDGKVPEVFVNARLRRALQANNIDFDLNFAKTPVNAITNRLKIASITSPDDATNKLISQIWQDNQLNLEMKNLFRRAGEFGDAYLMVLPVEDDNGAVVRVEMFYNSPQTVRIIYAEDNPRRKAFTIKRWCDGPYLRAELYYDDRTERWTTGKNSKGDRAADWLHWPADEDPESWVIEHDWGEQPVFHFRTDRPYGVPEHFGAYGPQNAITKLQATHMGTVDYQGAPQRYALTETATTDTSDLEPGDFNDGDWPEDDRGTGPRDSGEDSSLKAGPGEMWLLRGYKSVGQFDAANPDVFLDPITFNVKAMAQITETPLRMFDPQSSAQRSGVSYQEEDSPFVSKIEDRQTGYGSEAHAAFVFALRRLGIPDPVVTVDWVPARSVSSAEGWATVQAKIASGVPRRQALMEAGYRAEQVDAWLAGTDDAELQRRVDVLASLADSAQKLGAAAALGVITSEQVTGLLAGTIDDLEALATAQEEG